MADQLSPSAFENRKKEERQGLDVEHEAVSRMLDMDIETPPPKKQHHPKAEEKKHKEEKKGDEGREIKQQDIPAEHGKLGGPAKDPTPVDEGLDERAREAIDLLATRTARAIAGVQAKPTQASVSGYVGGRNAENADISNSSAAGTNRTGGDPRTGVGASVIAPSVRGGDAFVSAKESHNSSTDTLRPSFGIAPPNAVVPSRNAQVQSDIIFSDFSIVAPGHGLGVTNKMFLMEEMRDKKIVYREPLAEPRKYDGPTDGVTPPPLQWQNEITRGDRHTLAAQAIAEASAGVLLEARAGTGSLNVLGDDFGAFQRVSDKGLKRPADSPLEPVIRTHKPWERTRLLPGVQFARKEFRRLFDAVRLPERFKSNMAMDGGPTMGKRNSLATFPFPITSQ